MHAWVYAVNAKNPPPQSGGACRKTDLPEGVLEDMKRYISYAWPPGRIAQLLNRSYGLDLTREAVIHMLRRLKQESV